MCLDAKAMRSYAAWKGWETRRRRSRDELSNRPSCGVGYIITREPASIDSLTPWVSRTVSSPESHLPPITRQQETPS